MQVTFDALVRSFSFYIREIRGSMAALGENLRTTNGTRDTDCHCILAASESSHPESDGWHALTTKGVWQNALGL